MAQELGSTFSVRSSLTSAEHHAALVEFLGRDDIDAIILCGAEYLITKEEAASARHIPLIACLAVIQGVPLACHVVFDLYRAATLAAAFLSERLDGRANIVHIQGAAGSYYTTPRAEGFESELVQHPQMQIVFAEHGNWDRASGASIASRALAHNPNIQAVYAHSDEMALGALAALEAVGRSDVLVVGIDAIPETLKAIHQKRIAATVDVAPYELGRSAMTHAFELAQGRPAPPVVRTDVRLITRDNLQDAMIDTVSVFPNVLRDLVQGHTLQQQLQEKIIATQQTLIRELSTPIIPVSDSVLVVPLIGTIDTARAMEITSAILRAVSQQHAHTMIIDITGVAVVDTSVIQHLLQTASALRLLGTAVMLVGITPEVAQTIVQLGADLSSIVTRSTLQAGLEYAARH